MRPATTLLVASISTVASAIPALGWPRDVMAQAFGLVDRNYDHETTTPATELATLPATTSSSSHGGSYGVTQVSSQHSTPSSGLSQASSPSSVVSYASSAWTPSSVLSTPWSTPSSVIVVSPSSVVSTPSPTSVGGVYSAPETSSQIVETYAPISEASSIVSPPTPSTALSTPSSLAVPTSVASVVLSTPSPSSIVEGYTGTWGKPFTLPPYSEATPSSIASSTPGFSLGSYAATSVITTSVLVTESPSSIGAGYIISEGWSSPMVYSTAEDSSISSLPLYKAQASSPTSQASSPTSQASSPTSQASSPTSQASSPTSQASLYTSQASSPASQDSSYSSLTSSSALEKGPSGLYPTGIFPTGPYPTGTGIPPTTIGYTGDIETLTTYTTTTVCPITTISGTAAVATFVTKILTITSCKGGCHYATTLPPSLPYDESTIIATVVPTSSWKFSATSIPVGSSGGTTIYSTGLSSWLEASVYTSYITSWQLVNELTPTPTDGYYSPTITPVSSAITSLVGYPASVATDASLASPSVVISPETTTPIVGYSGVAGLPPDNPSTLPLNSCVAQTTTITVTVGSEAPLPTTVAPSGTAYSAVTAIPSNPEASNPEAAYPTEPSSVFVSQGYPNTVIKNPSLSSPTNTPINPITTKHY